MNQKVEESIAMAPGEIVNVNSTAEKTLKVFAKITLVLGIVGASLVFGLISSLGAYDFGPFALIIALLVAIVVLVGAVITWALLKVFADISITLKEINAKIK